MYEKQTNGNYLDKAEDDRKAFEVLRKSGSPYNVMGRLAEQVCEKQLKHLICLGEDITAESNYRIPNIPEHRKHDLLYLAKRAEADGMIRVSEVFRQRMSKLSHYLMETIYPDMRYSHDMTNKDIIFCMDAIDHCTHITATALKEWNLKKETKNQDIEELQKYTEKLEIEDISEEYDDEYGVE